MKNNDLLNDIMPEIDFTIRGNSYKERKVNLEEIAKEVQYQFNECVLFGSDIITLNDYFEKNGRRYGLLEVFKENGIV